MELDLSKVKFSNYDLRIGVRVPTHLDADLAYFLGVHIGDGNLGNYKKNYYTLEYSGHLIDELDFYLNFIAPLFKQLFNKDLRIYKIFREEGNFLRLCTQSKAIFTFFNASLGVVHGPKIQAGVPSIIKQTPYVFDFIRGLADADFSLSFKKRNKKLHYYPVISIQSSNFLLIEDVSLLLKLHNFKIYTCFNFKKKRYDKVHTSNLIDLNGVDQLELWMKIIGFNSRKHLTKYLIWKQFGFCPPNTSLPEREFILSDKLDPNSFYKLSPKSL